MPNTPRELPHLASPAGALGRLTATALAYAVAAGLIAASLPTILTPLPVAKLLPPDPTVVARTPVRIEAQP
jgi:hypothetical protein